MPLLPPSREIRRHLPLVAGALALTQIPALPLLLSGGRGEAVIAAYLLASALAFLGVIGVGYAWIARVQRIVGLVREYAEDGSLPNVDGSRPECSVEQVKASLTELDRAVRRLESDAARDPLTGLLNRRNCAARLEGDLARSRRGNVPFSVAIFDLDDLKTVNDTFGHAAGDDALRHVANVLQSVVREGDWVARWGGDEFLLGLWGADAGAAALVAGRVLDELSAAPAAVGGESATLGASVGVGQAQPDDDPTRLFSRVDAALLLAKRSGRGRVHLS